MYDYLHHRDAELATKMRELGNSLWQVARSIAALVVSAAVLIASLRF